MAQRDKEETELKVPETLSLCVNNCGFAGNPATNNMCQNCFKASTSNGILTPLTAPPKGKPGSTSIRSLDRSDETTGFGSREKPVKELQKMEGKATVARREVNRCTSCHRRVGLTGFRCRCGDLFCSEHRYSDRHVCSYDYKAAGREAIARENPMVRAAKIIRV